jgi:hypothetical protein
VLRFRVYLQPSGACSLTTTPEGAALQFAKLSDALASARVTAADEEADIEILGTEGFYVFVHQPRGWPKRLTR